MRFGSYGDTAPYSGGTKYGSGTVGGAGSGNKTIEGFERDSKLEKIIEKVGSVVGSVMETEEEGGEGV